MTLPTRDPLDDGRPGLKQWHEFHATFAGTLLLAWIVADLPDVAPEYYADLRARLDSAFDVADGLNEDDPSRDDWVPIRGPYDEDYESITWWPRHDADLLYDQLFPQGSSDEDHYRGWRGLAVVGFHSALEVYLKALGISPKRTPLPLAIKAALANRNPLDADTYSDLVDLDATRHLIVHNRGTVTDDYLAAVPYTKLTRDERRPLAGADLQRFATATWTAARQLRNTLGEGLA